MSPAGSAGRIARTFQRLAGEGRTGLVTFITAGDPTADATPELMRALVEGGSDLIELGMPFSDPMADGPTVQRSSERALVGGMTARRTLDLVRKFREDDSRTPVVLMGYVNPVERYGYAAFAADAEAAGVDGLVLVDLPADGLERFAGALADSALDLILLLAPTSPPERARLIAEHASGFIYYVSVKGVTGSVQPEVEQVRERISALKQLTDLPVGVGFGIRSPAQAATFATVADAVVVGSSLIEAVEEAVARDLSRAGVAAALRDKVTVLRQALDHRDTEVVAIP